MYTLFLLKGLTTRKDSAFALVQRLVFLHLYLGSECKVAGISQSGNDVSFGS